MADPVLVYDDDCGFCTWWADRFVAHADLQPVGFSALDGDLRSRLPEEYIRCSHVVTDEGVYSCGASVEEALLRVAPGSVLRKPVGVLRRFEAYRRFREWVYRQFADNRDFWGRFLSSPPPAREDGGARADE